MTTLLIVDDSPTDRKLIGGFFKDKSSFSLHFANDGAEGLEQIGTLNPDLVLTDMRMPNMDGLELVNSIRVRYAGIPVILMTAHGSELLAVQALEAGAASYVPKVQLAKKLVETVEDVLAIARAERSYARLISYLTRSEFQFEMENDPAAIDPLVDLVQQMVAGMRLCDTTDGFRMSVALKEALLNALYRGNLELTAEETVGDHLAQPTEAVRQRMIESPYRSRKIHVDLNLSPVEAVFTIRDEGPGFDVSTTLPPGVVEGLEGDQGRGLVLMKAFMDEVQFNDVGNEVRMVKRRT